MTRIFLLGLIQALATLIALLSILDLQSVIAQKIQAAMYIAMSSDHSVSLLPPSERPLGAKILIVPLQASFGTWYRLEKRDGGFGERGLVMKRWVLERWNATLRAWRGEELGMWEVGCSFS
jgi:hypothetical protein